MESLVQSFAFDGANVRIVMIDGEPWWVAIDVCNVLGYANATTAIADHCRGVARRYPIVDRLGRTQEARILCRADVFRLITGSTLPAAERFERWIFEKVLPQIQTTGAFVPEGAIVFNPHDPESAIAAVLASQQALLETKKQLAAAQPAIDFANRFETADGCLGLIESAKYLGFKPHDFINNRLAPKYIYRPTEGAPWRPIQKYLDARLFVYRDTQVVNGFLRPQTLLTPKGLRYFAQRPLPSLDD